jgi:phosphate transport system ATP-binding protein
MVSQRPNPFPKSIFDNVAFGPGVVGFHGGIHEIVERALRRSALWDELKDRLRESALGLSRGQRSAW